MNVSEVMTRDIHCCRPIDSMEQAAEIMWEQDCGCVPVVDDDFRLQGMITDRDIAMAAYTTGQRLRSLPVQRAMAQDVTSCSDSETVDAALQKLSERQLHRLPVVDEQQRVVGVLSMADIVRATGQLHGRSHRKLADELVGALTEVSRKRDTWRDDEEERLRDVELQRAATARPASSEVPSP